MPRKLTQEEFIERARQIHNGKYDYSLTKYDGKDSVILIICPKHGVFQQIAGVHLYNKSGCKECANEKLRSERQRSAEEFKEAAKKVHGSKYNYDNVVYVNSKTIVSVVCPIHGAFGVTPEKHTLRGQGCPVCGDESHKSKVFGVGINDLRLGTADPCYHIWHGILARTVCPEYKLSHPAYADCEICDEWIYLSNFKKFFDKYYRDGYHLDKDLFSNGHGRLYSPETCCFLPPLINTIISGNRLSADGLPTGIIRRGRKYQARICIGDKRVSLGFYNTAEKAYSSYKREKESRIKSIAKEFYTSGKIDENVFNALMKYEVK